MADNPQTNPPAGPSSIDDKIAQSQVLGFLKQKLRLEGDHRDLLRDSLREMRNSVRELERMTSRIETANRSTINLRDLNKEVVRINQSNYLAVQKLSEITKLYGIDQNNQTEALKAYNKIVEEKISKEQAYKKEVNELKNLEDSLLSKGKDVLDQAQQKATALYNQKELQNKLGELQNKIDTEKQKKDAAINAQIQKNKQDEIKRIDAIEKLQAKQNTTIKNKADLELGLATSQYQQKNIKNQIQNQESIALKALNKGDEERLNKVNREIDLLKESLKLEEHKEKKLEQQIKDNKILESSLKNQIKKEKKDLIESKDTGKKDVKTIKKAKPSEEFENAKKAQIAIEKQIKDLEPLIKLKLSAEQNDFIQKKKNLELSYESLAQAEQAVRVGTENLNEGELAYIGLQRQLELYEEQKKSVQGKLAIEKEVSKNIGLSGGFAKLLADKLKVGSEVSEAMILKARELAEQDSKRIFLQDALNKAKEKGTKEDIAEAQAALAAEGKQRGLLSKRFEVLKAGAQAAKTSFTTALKDPIAFAGMIGAAFTLAQKGLNKVGEAFSSAGNMLAGFSKHSSTMVRDLTSGITNLISQIPIVGGLISGLVSGLAAIADLILGQDDYIVKLGRSVGISKEESQKLYDNYSNINVRARENLMLNQLNTEQYYESFMQLSKNLGVHAGISQNMVEQNAILQKRLGITEQESTELLKNQVITGKTANEQVAAVLGQVKSLQAATGVAINYKDVIKTVTNLSGVLGLQFSKYPEKITRAVISTKALGMELSKLDSTADSFLDFESSISKEFEAQLLTGKDINLNKARELALNNDLAGLAEEITNQLGSSDEYLKMNRIQQEAIAAALGMSRNELGDILRQQVLYSKLGAKDEESYKNRVKYFRDMAKTQEGMAQAMRETSLGEKDLLKMFDQSALENFEDLINKIKIGIVDIARNSGFLEFFEGVVKSLSEPGKVEEFFNTVKSGFAFVSKIVLEITEALLKAVDYIPGVTIDPTLIGQIDQLKQTSATRIENLGKYTKEDIDRGIENKSIKEINGIPFKKDAKGEYTIQVKLAEDIKPQKSAEQVAQDYAKTVESRDNMLEKLKYAIPIIGPIQQITDEINYLSKLFGGTPKSQEQETGGVVHADGGIFARPKTLLDPKTNISHTFGEAGPEILIPLDQLGDMLSNTVARIESAKVSRSPNITVDTSQKRERPVNENYKFDLSVNVEGREIARATRDVIRNAADLKFDASTGVLGSA